ncbi:Alpha/Beta hydrolase protein [Kickxella alabastrina]|uniref:Alpha/Beta hydrolase protein n=1 Tax=Kickxella alabastrina TaxID=61397 RepID=UPI00221EFC14|nr:Alpha/Beta hydrolase protein [Kickxella alabastrina]KAI7825025.1 Alpha/Beta hydrolase protein [Kickxella alabastrina]
MSVFFNRTPAVSPCLSSESQSSSNHSDPTVTPPHINFKELFGLPPATPSPTSTTLGSSPDGSSSERPKSLAGSARSLLSVLSIANKFKKALSPKPSSPADLPADPLQSDQQEQRVNDLVVKYMDLEDRHTRGYVDVTKNHAPQRKRKPGKKPAAKCKVYYEVYGHGPRRLLFIMGMTGSTQYWRLQTRHFASLGDYTVCVFDNCGSGRSTTAPGPYKISQLARDALSVLDHLGWEKNINMVGVSLGGMIAQEMCLMRAGVFDSVCFVDTWHSAALAVPTVKEVGFAFKGMSLAGNPRGLIQLVFSKKWIEAPFHDAEGGEDGGCQETAGLNNGAVMLKLFEAIRADLVRDPDCGASPDSPPPSGSGKQQAAQDAQPGTISAHTPPRFLTPDMAPKAVSPDMPPKLPTPKTLPRPLPRAVTRLLERPKPLAHSRSIASLQSPPSTESQPPSLPKRNTGDIHQFIATLGHRLPATRVRSIRDLNPNTRFLIIHGEKDRVIRPFCARSFAKLLQCPLAWIPRAGHMPLIDSHYAGGSPREMIMYGTLLDAPFRIRRYDQNQNQDQNQS